MDQAMKFQDVVADGLPDAVCFALPRGTMAAVVTSHQDENDQLVRLALGLSKPDAGSISMLGEDVGAAGAKALIDLRKQVAVVYPSGGLVSNLKVWENLVLPLEYHSACTPSEIEARGMAVLKRVGYSGGVMELPGHLSLYEKRLVGLARAMLTEPRLIIYNAILLGLRGDEKSAIIAAATEFHREAPERTSLFLTPNPESIRDMPFDSRIFLKGSAA